MRHDVTSVNIDQLPLYTDLIYSLLEKAVIQLRYLETPHYQLDNEARHGLLNLYKSQIAENAFFIDACNKWREQSPSNDQLLSIAQIERNAHELDLIFKEISHLLTKLPKNKVVDINHPRQPMQHLDNLSFESILNAVTEPPHI